MKRVLIIDDQAPAFAGEIEADVRDDHGNAPEIRQIGRAHV